MTDKTLQGILGKLRKAYADAQAAYFAFGDAMVQLRSHGYSWQAARQVILDAFPNMQADTGITLSAAWLKGAHDAAHTFRESGGLTSPDGKHQVTREEFSSIGLPTKERERAINLLAYSESKAHVKGTPKLRVSDVASAARAVRNAKNPGEKRAAQRELVAKMDKVEGGLDAVTHGNPSDVLHEQVAAMKVRVEKARDNLAKLENAYSELREKLQAQLAAEAAESEAATPAEVSQLTAAKGGKRRPRPATATVAQAASS